VVNGHPAIAYVDSTAAEVRYVCASDPWGMAWSVPVSVGTGGASSMSLRVVANHPAVAYLTAGFNGELRYVRALDATGNGWAAPAALQACSDLTMDASLAIVNGKPAISYQGDSCLRYVQASDAEGASWGTPVTVDDTWLSGAFNTLVVVNGRPAISYYMAGLRYVRANDADGSAWGTPIGVVPDEAEGTGNWAAMLVLGGVPAVSFYESISAQAPARGMLSFIRAADADGVSWHPRQVLDDGAGGDVGRGSALALIGGLPAVSYVDDTNGALVHIWALDARGESWAAPQVVDGSGHVGGRCSLAEVNGCPAISYCDGYNWDLKYAAYF